MEDYENDDVSDSEDELTENDKILLKKNRSSQALHGSDSEEEIYGLLSSSDESENIQEADDITSDIEENKSDDLPDSRAWGHKRKNFYDTDLDPDYSGIQEKDEEAAELEELEARNIQERLAEQLDAGTEFSLDVLSTQMQPVTSDVCLKLPVQSHPIIKRVFQLRQLMSALTELGELVIDQIDPIMKMINKDQEVNLKDARDDEIVAEAKYKLEGMPEPLLEEKIQTDLSKLTKRQKLDLIKKESPEFFGLVNDFKEKMTEIINVWQPMKKLLLENKLKSPLVEHLVQTKHTLILNYCTHTGLYLLLKCLKVPVQSHPIIKRVFQLRQLMSALTELGELVIDQINPIMKMINKDQEVNLKDARDDEIVAEAKRANRKKRLLNFLQQEPEIKKCKAESYEEMIHEGIEKKSKLLKSILKTSKEPALPGRGKMYKKKQDGNGDDGNLSDDGEERIGNGAEEEAVEKELEEEGKRAITYQMAKNKGLTPRRKKEQRNPRVKHRNKFRKAKIRRKGQIREVRVEASRYGGEISGIKASVSKSIKIK